MFLSELRERIGFWRSADRIGPDIPWTHWRLHFQSTMRKLCQSKFESFDDTSVLRPGAYAIACSKIVVGRNVVVRPGSMLYADPRDRATSITIADDVLLGSCVHLYVTTHEFDRTDVPIFEQGHREAAPIVIERGAWIGANVTILPGVTIGENAVVGAGSIVTRDIPPRTVAVGNPAEVIREIA